MIYLDNAATTWPKPESVAAAMVTCLAEQTANPGRSGHQLSMAAGRVVFAAREAVANLVGLADPLAVAFTKNATEALNLALFGVLAPGDHVITSRTEHNSVLRPLKVLEERGIAVTRSPCGADATLSPDEVADAFTPRTRLVVLTHASNVVGTLNPVAEIGRVVREREALFCVDAAQTAGVAPVDMEAMGIDLLAFTGHKSLYGPQGTGGLCLGPRVPPLRPLIYGGTGSLSDSDEHPDFLPDSLEAGTVNTVGLAGLLAGIEFVESRGLARVMADGRRRIETLTEGLRALPGVQVLSPAAPYGRTPVVSFRLEGFSSSEVAWELEQRAGICCRAGLHCAPLLHRELGTFPDGAVRLSPGAFTDSGQIETTLAALAEIILAP